MVEWTGSPIRDEQCRRYIMAERSLHTDNQMCSWYRSRSLEQNFPDLMPFLYGGADVLDVGCGPGTVTAGVAQLVAPGIATGVDTQPELIDIAAAGRLQSGIDNLRFEVADACALPLWTPVRSRSARSGCPP